MRVLKGILAGALAVGVSVPALADTQGWYAGAQVGYNGVQKMSDHGAKAEFDPGFGVGGQVGYGWGQFRLEGELGYRLNDVDKVRASGVSESGKGHISATTLMLNALYDFDTGTNWVPYVGVGIGGAYLDASKIKGRSTGYDVRVDDSDFVFAYQGIVGLGYEFTPNLTIRGDYRFLGTTEASYKVKGADRGDTTKFKDEYFSHALMVGFTYKFYAPTPVVAAEPAPQVEAPAPVVAKSYLVFFDFDRADITPEAHDIIGQAADAANQTGASTIDLIGHTDAAGSAKYNMALSLRRANAVKAVLVNLGIPASEISVVGKGKSDPLVATADGVREPQNRRVQIILP